MRKVIPVLLLIILLTSCSQSQFTPSARTLTTAAHLGEIEGYTCIYSDEASDVAVYLKNNYKATAPPLNSRVSLAKTEGTIIDISDSEFAVEVDDVSPIIPGVSGSPVLYEGVPIGFISGWNGSGALRCIFY